MSKDRVARKVAEAASKMWPTVGQITVINLGLDPEFKKEYRNATNVYMADFSTADKMAEFQRKLAGLED